MLEYYNLITNEVKSFSRKEFNDLEDKYCWLEYSIIKEKIVLLSINNYKIFPKDELGFNKSTVLNLLNIYKPATVDTALKIAKYYKVCPYCLRPLEQDTNIIIMDCKEDFSNIKKMQFDLYFETSCCCTTFSIPFDKTLSNKAKGKFLKEKLHKKDNLLLFILYRIKDSNVEIMIDFDKLVDYCFNNNIELNSQNNVFILNEIINNNLFLVIKQDGNIIEDIDKFRQEVILW